MAQASYLHEGLLWFPECQEEGEFTWQAACMNCSSTPALEQVHLEMFIRQYAQVALDVAQ